MCDASNFALGVVLAQRINNQPHVIHYASKTLDATQINYITTKKELLTNVHVLEKFISYLLSFIVLFFFIM